MDRIFRDTEQGGWLHDALLMREAHRLSAAPGMFCWEGVPASSKPLAATGTVLRIRSAYALRGYGDRYDVLTGNGRYRRPPRRCGKSAWSS